MTPGLDAGMQTLSEVEAGIEGATDALRRRDLDRLVAASETASQQLALLLADVSSQKDALSGERLCALRASVQSARSALETLASLNGESLAQLLRAATLPAYSDEPGACRHEQPASLRAWEA